MPNMHHQTLTRYLDIDLKDVLTSEQREEILFLATSGMIHERNRHNRDVDLAPPPPKPELPQNETIEEYYIDPLVLSWPLLAAVVVMFIGLMFLLFR